MGAWHLGSGSQDQGAPLGVGEKRGSSLPPSSAPKAASYHKAMDEQQGLLLNGDSGSMQLA